MTVGKERAELGGGLVEDTVGEDFIDDDVQIFGSSPVAEVHNVFWREHDTEWVVRVDDDDSRDDVVEGRLTVELFLVLFDFKTWVGQVGWDAFNFAESSFLDIGDGSSVDGPVG